MARLVLPYFDEAGQLGLAHVTLLSWWLQVSSWWAALLHISQLLFCPQNSPASQPTALTKTSPGTVEVQAMFSIPSADFTFFFKYIETLSKNNPLKSKFACKFLLRQFDKKRIYLLLTRIKFRFSYPNSFTAYCLKNVLSKPCFYSFFSKTNHNYCKEVEIKADH